jgi:4-hydroxy-3-polyprenylbenzoate decarboxylase
MSRSNDTGDGRVDRRQLLAGAAALAAGVAGTGGLATPGEARAAKGGGHGFPYDSFRDWIGALEDRGLLMRIPRLDQDAWEMTALAFRLMDEFGWYGAPAVLAEEVKINGKWMKGPVVFNHQGHWDTEALVFGLEPVPGHGTRTYQKALDHFLGIVDRNGGKMPEIPTLPVARDTAPVKEVVLRGDEVDLTKFPFITSNPGDSGRYVNTGSVFTRDPELGMNFGTYRCEIHGPRVLGVNPEPGQRAYKMFNAEKARGDKFAKVSIVLGQDPMMWMVSGSALTKGNLDDELAITGGLRGKAVEVVKSETNDHMIPAHAEMVIEGEVPLQEPMLPEGPFGEMYGYLGLKKDQNFWMNVTCITHRKNPWILNQFTGVTRGFTTAPTEAFAIYRLRKQIPNLVGLHSPVEATGWTFVSIDKTGPGQGLEVGRKIARIIGIAKVVVVVDKDIDVLNRTEMMHIIGSRWQPSPASEVIKEAMGMPLDPSAPVRGKSSKMVIDATKQLPEEGGPPIYTERNRDLLTRLAPDSWKLVDASWERYLKGWKGMGCPPRSV